MNPLVLDILIEWVTTAIAALGGYFVAKGWISPEQSATFEHAAGLRAAQYLALVGPPALKMWIAYRTRLRELAIHALPADADEGAIRLKMMSLSIGDLFGRTKRRALERRLEQLEAWRHACEAAAAAPDAHTGSTGR